MHVFMQVDVSAHHSVRLFCVWFTLRAFITTAHVSFPSFYKDSLSTPLYMFALIPNKSAIFHVVFYILHVVNDKTITKHTLHMQHLFTK